MRNVRERERIDVSVLEETGKYRILKPSRWINEDRRGSALTEEDQHGAHPLQGGYDVPKQDDGAQDGEELPGGGDDGAGQRPEAHHRHEDEGLEKGQLKKKLIIKIQRARRAASSPTHLPQSAGHSKQQDVVDDLRVAFGKTQEVPHFTRPQHGWRGKTTDS